MRILDELALTQISPALKKLRLNKEWLARAFVIGLILGLSVLVVLARWSDRRRFLEIHARMPENGGWTPANLSARVGQPLRLRLISDDVMHSFAIGQTAWEALDLYPGKPVETTLIFDHPGKYVFYCTRWCGLNHWRMRGVIEVYENASMTQTPETAIPDSPLYRQLAIDLDAPHPALAIPKSRPIAVRDTELNANIPSEYLLRDYYLATAPASAWQSLRGEQNLTSLSDQQVWDLVAGLWRMQTNQAELKEGEKLYRTNCSACHGETGAGDGVMARWLAAATATEALNAEHSQLNNQHLPGKTIISGHSTVEPTDFTNPRAMLGASPALLQGKIIRGGMGTGMPYWGPIFTEEQTWALVAYLWTFQFDYSQMETSK